MKRLLYIWDVIVGARNWRYEYRWSTPEKPAWSDWIMHSTVMYVAKKDEYATGRVQYTHRGKDARNRPAASRTSETPRT